ncbi:DUF1499 domain-containing protein [Terrarubrum flagellatum]|uniref:DUF1499 domain-containing protein n=1 Tax=Terrirubrum flagellatum TaxID=2895980 RepID=UPI003144FC5E
MRAAVLEDPVSRAAVWSGRIAWFALVVAAIGVVLARFGRVEPAQAVGVLGASFLVALIAIGVAIFGLVVIWNEGFRGAGRAFGAIGLAGALLLAPAWFALKAATLPDISDVSTDLADPPAFSRSRVSLEARGGRVRSLPDADARAKQRRSYGGLAPATLERTPDEAFAIARDAARNLGWRIIEANPPAARSGVATIEAIDYSLVLRFPDDVTIRVRPLANGSRIDARSASRFGSHDFGANARRIQRYLQEVASINEAK